LQDNQEEDPVAIAFCPDCEEPVRVATPKLGQRVACQSCGAELEIVEVSPLELDWAYDETADDWEEEEEEEADDWDDEEDLDDDDWDDDEEEPWEDGDDQ
jgi:alpha-aminoadipate/glutamate carrier protein LysW